MQRKLLLRVKFSSYFFIIIYFIRTNEMNKIVIIILCLCCAFTVARAEDGPALNPSDANIVGHVVDRKTGEHLSFITIFLKGTPRDIII